MPSSIIDFLTIMVRFKIMRIQLKTDKFIIYFFLSIFISFLSLYSNKTGLSQETPNSILVSSNTAILNIKGLLESGDNRFADDTYYDKYTFQGRAGQSINISVRSSSFNPLVLLKLSDNKVLKSSPNNQSRYIELNSIILPSTGVYTILINTYHREDTGEYSLEVTSSTNQYPSSQLTRSEIVENIANQITVVIYTPEPRNPNALMQVGCGVIIGSIDSNNSLKTYYVLTAKHVAYRDNSKRYIVKTPDGNLYTISGETIQEVQNSDLSSMTFSSNRHYSVAELKSSNDIKKGEQIYIYGQPKLSSNKKLVSVSFRNHLTNLTQADQGYSMTYSVSAENGMSGGPILNSSGNVVGIHGRDNRFFQLGIPIETFVNKSGLAFLRAKLKD